MADARNQGSRFIDRSDRYDEYVDFPVVYLRYCPDMRGNPVQMDFAQASAEIRRRSRDIADLTVFRTVSRKSQPVLLRVRWRNDIRHGDGKIKLDFARALYPYE